MRQAAIVGMAALFPAAATLDAYWSNVVGAVDAITDVPENRWDSEFYDPEQAHRPDRLYCHRGGFVDDAAFEPLKYGMMPSAVDDIEPDQLLALEVAAAAIDDAGGADRMPDPDRIGVILGRGGYLSPAQARFNNRVRMSAQIVSVLRELLPNLDAVHLEQVRKRIDERFGKQQPEGAIGLTPNLAASRIANRLDLRGPAYTIDAACASSLLAVDQGLTELASGRLDAVLAGGVHHVHDVTFWSVFCQLGAVSRKGQSKPFDAEADGLLIGEGTGMVVLKRLADAERDGDRIYAVIRGAGTSSDGRSASIFNPTAAGQVLAVRRAWAEAELDPTAPDALGLLEAHGTATPIGDATELQTLADVFGPQTSGDKPVIGSVKSMIGHTMPAAGIAGLIKATLAVHHAVQPPTLHCDHPRAEMGQTRFAPLAEPRAWESASPRRAGVNAFGFGGINAHVLLEQHSPPVRARPRRDVTVTEPEAVLWLSAADPAALSRLLDADDRTVCERGLAEARSEEPSSPARTARLGLVDPTPQRLAAARRIVARGEAWRGGRDVWFTPRPLLGSGGSRLAFVFPGLEAEFAPRAPDVAEHFGLPYRERSASDLAQQNAGLVDVGCLLAAALRKVNVIPDAVAGYSIGEWTAAAVSGQVSVGGIDEIVSAYDVSSINVSGYVFAVVSAGAATVMPLLTDYAGVLLSHDNSPAQCVVNGPSASVQQLVDDLRSRNVLCQLLPFRSAFHTPAFADSLPAIAAALGRHEVHLTDVQVWSGTLAAPFPTDPTEVSALFARHLVEPVRFRETINAMYDGGIRVFLQVGPGQLTSLIDDNLRGRDHLAVPVNVPRRSGLDQLRRVATALWVDGGQPDLNVLDPTSASPQAPPDRARPERSVVVPTAANGPTVPLDFGGRLLELGHSADQLLGLDRRRPLEHVATGARAQGAASAEETLPVLAALAERSGAAAELAALMEQTASDVITVLRAGDRGSPAQRPADKHTVSTPPRPAQDDFPAAADEVVLQTKLSVSVEEMPYLLDHCFFVQPADWPTVEDRCPVVPATTLVQHMMDAAELAAPGLRAIGLREAKFSRWLIAAPPVEVKTTVRRAGPGLLSVVLDGYARAIVEVATHYPIGAVPWTHDPATERPPTVSAEQMYTERWLFHGPLFQGLTAVHALGERHVRGVVTAPPAPGSLLDNALQLCGNWLFAAEPQRSVALPVAINQIRFFSPPAASGTVFDCVARICSIDHEQLVVDVQLCRGGQVWAQIDGAIDRRFDNHPAGRAAERFPGRNAMSVRHPGGWTMAFDHWTDLVTQGLAARNLLGVSAYAEYEQLPAARRKSWLLGRIAVKDAVRFRQWDAGISDVFPIELTVGNDANGAPQVDLRPGRGLIPCSVSLAHSAEVGVALAAPTGDGVVRIPGIDVVEVTARDEKTIRYALTEEELGLLDRLGGDRELWFARLWAAKEAVGKARRTGLDWAPRHIVIQDVAEITDSAVAAELTVAIGDQRYCVAVAELENPPELPARRYVVGWTWGPEHDLEGGTGAGARAGADFPVESRRHSHAG